MIIACWLLYNNEWPDADSALAFYAAARTHNQKGVTIPSQLRYGKKFILSLIIISIFIPYNLNLNFNFF